MALHDTPTSDTAGEAALPQYRIERGATAMGPDGPLGTVEQIVVERGTGELRAVIVRGSESGAEFELPAAHIDRSRTSGNQVYFDVGRGDLAKHPGLATPYDPDQYVPVYQGEMAPPAQATRVAAEHDQAVVTEVEANAAEVILPESSTHAAEPSTRASIPPQRSPGERAPSTQQSTTDDIGSASTVPTPRHPSASLSAGQQAAPEDRGYADRSRDIQTQGETTDVLPVNPSPPAVEAQSIANQLIKPGEAGYRDTSKPLADRIDSSGQTTWSKPLDLSEPQPGREGAAVVGVQLPLGATMGQTAGTVPPERLRGLELTGDVQQSSRLSLFTTPLAITLAVLGLGGGALAGALATIQRRRSSPTYRTGQKVKDMMSSAAEVASSVAEQARKSTGKARSGSRPSLMRARQTAGVAATSARASAKQVRRSARRGVKRTARRVRWFRNGLMLGTASAILFAPESGSAMREQLAHRVELCRNRLVS